MYVQVSLASIKYEYYTGAVTKINCNGAIVLIHEINLVITQQHAVIPHRAEITRLHGAIYHRSGSTVSQCHSC